jgi:hypothetical protein
MYPINLILVSLILSLYSSSIFSPCKN